MNDNITKASALKRISSMEEELKGLRKIVESTEPQKITDRVKTFPDALKIYINKVGPLSSHHKSLLEYSGSDKEMLAAQALCQLSIIRTALNEDWTADWNNGSQVKYWPWFNISGSGLTYDFYDYDYSISSVGSRLCYATRELAKYAATQFLDIYSKLFL